MTGRPLLVALRPLGLGDLLTAVPALRALARSFPGHERVLVTTPAVAPLARHAALADRVVDGAPLAPLPASLHGAEVVVNLHGRGPQSHRVALAARPHRLVAFANADDPRLRLRYGRRWREVTGVQKGRRARHLAVTGAGLLSVAAGAARRRSVARAAAAVWVAGTAELAWARIAPGPRTADEVATMVVTSVALPPAATWHWLRGWVGLATRG